MKPLNLDRSTYDEKPFEYEGVARRCEVAQETDANDDPRYAHTEDCEYDRSSDYGDRYSCGKDAGCMDGGSEEAPEQPMISLHWEIDRDDGRGTSWNTDGHFEVKVPYANKPYGRPYQSEPSKGSPFDREQERLSEEIVRMGGEEIVDAAGFKQVEGHRVKFQSIKSKNGNKYYDNFVAIID